MLRLDGELDRPAVTRTLEQHQLNSLCTLLGNMSFILIVSDQDLQHRTRIPFACSTSTGLPPQSCRIAHSRIERCKADDVPGRCCRRDGVGILTILRRINLKAAVPAFRYRGVRTIG